MGRQPLRVGRRIDRAAMNRAAGEIFTRLGVALDPQRQARGLSVADQQIVEIAKALSSNSNVLVMDEPTAALTPVEVERLFEVIRTLRKEGAAVLFISHRLEEVFAICQRVTIMRDGRFVRTAAAKDLTVDDVIRSMVGRDLDVLFPKTATAAGEVVLQVENLGREGVLYDITFAVRRGEIVALAGLVGAGRSEVARAIFGIDRRSAGVVTVNGTSCRTGRRWPRWRPGSPWCPKTGGSRAWSWTSASTGTSRWPRSPAEPVRPHQPHPRAGPRRDLGRAAAAEVRPAVERGLHAVRREPAEGRAGQVAGPRAHAADRRRADPRHRRRHQGRGAPPPRRARRRGRRGADDLLRAARGARHGRPDPGHARRADRRGDLPRGGRRGLDDAGGDRPAQRAAA